MLKLYKGAGEGGTTNCRMECIKNISTAFKLKFEAAICARNFNKMLTVFYIGATNGGLQPLAKQNVVSINFSCNITRCRFGDFDVIFITMFLKSNINYILRVRPFPEENSGCIYNILFSNISDSNPM